MHATLDRMGNAFYVDKPQSGSTESKPRGQLTLGDDPETKDVVNAAIFMREI